MVSKKYQYFCTFDNFNRRSAFMSVSQGASQLDGVCVVGAADWSRTGVKCCLLCVFSCCPALCKWSHSHCSQRVGPHCQVTKICEGKVSFMVLCIDRSIRPRWMCSENGSEILVLIYSKKCKQNLCFLNRNFLGQHYNMNNYNNRILNSSLQCNK